MPPIGSSEYQGVNADSPQAQFYQAIAQIHERRSKQNADEASLLFCWCIKLLESIHANGHSDGSGIASITKVADDVFEQMLDYFR